MILDGLGLGKSRIQKHRALGGEGPRQQVLGVDIDLPILQVQALVLALVGQGIEDLGLGQTRVGRFLAGGAVIDGGGAAAAGAAGAAAGDLLAGGDLLHDAGGDGFALGCADAQDAPYRCRRIPGHAEGAGGVIRQILELGVDGV